MPDPVYAVASGTLWGVVAWRARHAARPGAERSLWFVLAMLACAITVQLSPVRARADRTLSAVGGTAWVYLSCAVLAAAGARSLVEHVRGDPPARRRLRLHVLAAVAALVLITVSFLDTPRISAGSGGTYTALEQRAPLYAGGAVSLARWLAWLSLLVWALSGMAQVTGQYAEHAERVTPGRLTTGLRLGAIGCRVGYGHVVLKTFIVLGWVAGHGPRLLVLDDIAESFAFASIALITVGSTHDALTSHVRRLGRTLHQLRALWQLRRLSAALYRAVPDDSARISGVGVQSRLMWRVVGIRDRELALRHYVGAGVLRSAYQAACAAGFTGDHAHVVAEAAWLEAARLAKARGLAPAAAPADPSYELRNGQDLDAEVRLLVEVARAHRDCPVVPAFAAAHNVAS